AGGPHQAHGGQGPPGRLEAVTADVQDHQQGVTPGDDPQELGGQRPGRAVQVEQAGEGGGRQPHAGPQPRPQDGGPQQGLGQDGVGLVEAAGADAAGHQGLGGHRHQAAAAIDQPVQVGGGGAGGQVVFSDQEVTGQERVRPADHQGQQALAENGQRQQPEPAGGGGARVASEVRGRLG